MTHDARFGRLPCGQPIEALIDQVTDSHQRPATAAHQASCQHCRSELAELDRLWEPVRQLADEDVVVPERLVEDVIRVIRHMVYTGWHTLQYTARGATRISAWVVSRVAETAARKVPGVHRVHPTPLQVVPGLPGAPALPSPQPDTPAVEVGEQQRAVDLELVAEYGVNLIELAESVRQQIVTALQLTTGLDVTEVNLHVVDVDPHPTSRSHPPK